MTTAEKNTALYEKMSAEQEEYRKWLLAQTPEKILEHAYEFAMRREIVAVMEDVELIDLSEKQTDVLLSAEHPLADIYKAFSNIDTQYADITRGCVEEYATAIIQQEQERREALRKLPVYPYPGDYAREHGELELYRESRRANVACRDAIDKAIAEHYKDNSLNCKAAVAQVVDEFGYERMLHVCACTIRDKEWDGRISRDNIQWAHTVPIFEDNDGFGFNRRVDYIVDRSHPRLTDMFVKAARREYLRTQPLTPEEIRAEALNILAQFQNAREPNSPSGTHYAARVTPFFLERANGKAADMLGKFLPFQSLTFTTFTDRRGIYAVIAKHEDRSRKLRSVRASVLEKLQKPLSPTSPKHSAKSREQER